MYTDLKTWGALLLYLCATAAAYAQTEQEPAADPPNILWIYVEDQSPYFGCYGNAVNAGHTPNVDAIAQRGTLFERCYMPAPVCSPCRSALITGAMQTTLGLHNHRSSRHASAQIALPEGVKPIPQLMQEAGYYTFNHGKEDYNFTFRMPDLYSANVRRGSPDASHPWRGRDDGQPFFGQIQLTGGKHWGAIRNGRRNLESPTDRDAVEVPAYFPDLPILQEHFALHHDTARVTDHEVGVILDRLAQDGLLDNTVVFFFTDHGMNNSMRAKQFCYEEGVHVPLVIMWMGHEDRIAAGDRRDELVSGLDISATTFALAGLEAPAYFEGSDLFAQDHSPRSFVISARDRCDYTIDRTRTVRTERYRYIRHYLTDRAMLQPQYRDGADYFEVLREAYEAGDVPDAAARMFAVPRPAEELYDMERDPLQLVNLAGDADYAQALGAHRDILSAWIEATDDQGQYPESEAGLRAVLRQWKDRCVNPEYNAVR
ncbi:sulfatase [Phycisphaeraceae bacterium D3-23]